MVNVTAVHLLRLLLMTSHANILFGTHQLVFVGGGMRVVANVAVAGSNRPVDVFLRES
jgi:hypothetical protein